MTQADTAVTAGAKHESIQSFLGHRQDSTPNGTAYDIVGEVNPRVLVTLKPGTPIIAQSGAANWFDDKVQWDLTANRQGVWGTVKRMFGGEPDLLLGKFSSTENDQHVSLSATRRGSVIPMELKAGQSIIVNSGAFLAAEEGVEVTNEFQLFRRPLFGLFGGEGLWMQKIDGPMRGSATVFLNPGGTVEKVDLKAGQHLRTDNGNIAIRDPEVETSLVAAGGIGKMALGGRGLTMVDVSGPGSVYLQHKGPSLYAGSGQMYNSGYVGHDNGLAGVAAATTAGIIANAINSR